MALPTSQMVFRGKIGRVYFPSLAVLYLYSLTANVQYWYLAIGGVIAAVSLHAQNFAIFGPEGALSNMDAQDERFPRRLISIFKKGRFEDYPQSRTEVLTKIDEIPFDWRRLPTIILSVYSWLMAPIVIFAAIWGFWQNYSSLDFIGLTILFAMAVFLLQPLFWRMYWSVSNQRDNQHPAIDTPNHHRISDFYETLEDKSGIRVRKNEYRIENGGEIKLICNIRFSEKEDIQWVIQVISFAYAGLVESSSYPHSNIDAKLIDPEGNGISFTVSRQLVHQYNTLQIDEGEFIGQIIDGISM